MLDANDQVLALGDTVRLTSKPTGQLSSQHPLTVGSEYTVVDFMGSNVVTTTDAPRETASYWRGRVVKA